MSNRTSEGCAILGASGHGKVVAEIAELNGYRKVCFFDDRWPELSNIEHWPVIGNNLSMGEVISNYDWIVAIGHNATRLQKLSLLKSLNASIATLIHPTACVSQHSKLGKGCVVMAKAVINPFCQVGEGAILNTACTIDHDCSLAEGVHVSPGANIAGGVKIGSASWIGIGSQIKQLVCIGANAVIGAGTTVIKDISDDQTVVGNPARTIKQK